MMQWQSAMVMRKPDKRLGKCRHEKRWSRCLRITGIGLQALQYTIAQTMALRDHVMSCPRSRVAVSGTTSERDISAGVIGRIQFKSGYTFSVSLLHDFADDEAEVGSIMSLV
jgi:hypothetical protein